MFEEEKSFSLISKIAILKRLTIFSLEWGLTLFESFLEPFPPHCRYHMYSFSNLPPPPPQQKEWDYFSKNKHYRFFLFIISLCSIFNMPPTLFPKYVSERLEPLMSHPGYLRSWQEFFVQFTFCLAGDFV